MFFEFFTEVVRSITLQDVGEILKLVISLPAAIWAIIQIVEYSRKKFAGNKKSAD